MAEKNFNNVRIINKHDTEENWLKATGFTPKQGELIVYDIDSTHSYERIKIGDGVQNVNNLPFVTDAMAPKYTTITLQAANWIGDTNPWSQVVAVNAVTANSKVDLNPTAVQIVELQNNDIALMAENDNGVITVYALGSKPVVDYTMQAIITEVAVV